MNAAAPANFYAGAASPQSLRKAWHALTAESPLRIRDAAIGAASVDDVRGHAK